MTAPILKGYPRKMQTSIRRAVKAQQAPAARPITMRAFAPKGTRVTVQGLDRADCLKRLRAICRDLRLPIRATLATARMIQQRSF